MSTRKSLSPVYHFGKSFFEILLDFIYPPTCIQCHRRLDHSGFLCDECEDAILRLMRPAFQKGRHDFHHLEGEILFDEAITFWDYTPDIEQLIFQVKYQRKKKLGLFLGQQLGKAFISAYGDWERSVIIPVPLHKVRHRERGYNQSEILCRGISECVKVPIYYDGLIRNRHTSTQTRLSAKERQENVKDAFEVNPSFGIQGKVIVLVDDVITTGATVNNCAACLKKAGARKVIGIALARPQLE